MVTILRGTTIEIDWKVVSAFTKQPIDFEGVEARLYLIAPDNKYVIPFEVERDAFRGLKATVSTEGLTTGVYDIKVIWLRDHLCHHHDYRNVSKKCSVFAITDNPMEVNYDESFIKIVTAVESFGRDGMSAYEIATFYGVTDDEWTWGRLNVGDGLELGEGRELKVKTTSQFEFVDGALALSSKEGFATVEDVEEKVAELVGSAPETLDTLGELAEAIEDNREVLDVLKEIAHGKDEVFVESIGSRVLKFNGFRADDVAIGEMEVQADASRVYYHTEKKMFFALDAPTYPFAYYLGDSASHGSFTVSSAPPPPYVKDVAYSIYNGFVLTDGRTLYREAPLPEGYENDSTKKYYVCGGVYYTWGNGSLVQTFPMYSAKFRLSNLVDSASYAEDPLIDQRYYDMVSDDMYAWKEGVLAVYTPVEGGGGGITIVSSIDELDPNAPQGSLASLAVNEPDIARPIEECYIKATENPYLIKSLEYKESTEEWSFNAVFGAYGLDNSVIPVEQMFNIYGDINYLNVWFTDNGVVEDTLISGGEINTELLNKICKFISSLGGVVLYGTYSDNNDTHVNVTGIDEHSLWSLNQVFNFICAGTQETTLCVKDVNGWRNINEIKIVDSVNKLNKNAPQGSLASVAVNTVGEVSFSKLHQPTSDEVNMGIGAVDTTKLSRVSEISINSSYDTSVEPMPFEGYLFSKDIDVQGGVGQAVMLAVGMAATMNFATQEQQELELFTPYEDGTITVNEENLVILNSLLSSTEFVYGGFVNMTNGEPLDPSYADMFYKAIGSISKTDSYIKYVYGWEEFKTGSAVVNNLKDGGFNKALSAEMGKVLNTSMEELKNDTKFLKESRIIVEDKSQLSDYDGPQGTLASVTSTLKTKLISVPTTVGSQLQNLVLVDLNYNIGTLPVQGFNYYLQRYPLGIEHYPIAIKGVFGANWLNLYYSTHPSSQGSLLATLNVNTGKFTYISEEIYNSINSVLSSKEYRVQNNMGDSNLISYVQQILKTSVSAPDDSKSKLYIKDKEGWSLCSPTKTSELTNDSAFITEGRVEELIEEVNTKIDMYKEATIDFGTGEDTVTMAIMESGTTLTKVKMKNVKTLYLSYGDVTKEEYAGGEVSLGNADFLVMTIVRTASDVDAVVGLTLR